MLTLLVSHPREGQPWASGWPEPDSSDRRPNLL